MGCNMGGSAIDFSCMNSRGNKEKRLVKGCSFWRSLSGTHWCLVIQEVSEENMGEFVVS